MNENKRILLLALGIMAILASDPPVASYFERPHSACRIVADLAVGAFDSLVRSTLPLPNSQPEVEQTDEILIARTPSEDASQSGRTTTIVSNHIPEFQTVIVPHAMSSVSPIRMVSAEPVRVHRSCSGTDETIDVLRVEAVMEVHAETIERG